MQLILCSDIDIGINNKMSSINEETLSEKDAAANIVDNINNEIENGNKENIEKRDNIITDCDEKDDNENNCHEPITEDSANDKDFCKETEQNQINEESNNTVKSIVSSENASIDNVIIDSQTDVVLDSEESAQISENGTEEIENKIIDNPSIEEIDNDQTENIIGDLTDNADPLKDSASIELDNNSTSKVETVETKDILIECNDMENSSSVTENDEIIDIADDRPVEDITIDHNTQIDDKSIIDTVHEDKNTLDDKVSVSIKYNNNKTNEAINIIEENECSEIEMVADTAISDPLENSVIQIDNIDETVDVNNVETRKESTNEVKVTEKKKLTLLSNLSNTLDILSDDDEDPPKENESQKELSLNEVPNSTDKQCINIEDDDDIMVIDDEVTVKESKCVTNDTVQPTIETTLDTDVIENSKIDCDIKEDKPVVTTTKDDDMDTVTPKSNEPEIVKDQGDLKTEEKVEPPKNSLLPVTFLKTCKKNLADMTRDELEEFCIIKIVESVVDRSNLGDIKSQLKSMAQNIEEYKNRTKMLTKQNRDLQVVLKSVQEEQKKNSGSAITPLKITRSVGIQVLMNDKNSRKRNSVGFNPTTPNNTNTTNLANRQIRARSQTIQLSKNAKTPNAQQIPVPRLIPAVNVNNTKNSSSSSPQNANNSPKTPTTNNVANGLKVAAPASKPEKRSHGKMQQNSAVTVDLTDDEPPAKVLTRNTNTPVRCVPPQNLLAPRQPLGQAVNSPRKVYIPISGPQSQTVRPGQTIMLKAITPQNTRPRGNAPNVKMLQNTNSPRMGRVAFKHPAPLPDSMKQYQPPNWKALPPAPELKLSKVENGIVISWKIDGYQEDNHEEIASYQLFAYQETSLAPPSTSLWKKIGDVKALPLPMACTLTQFMAGYKYYFAVRAVDIRSRFGPFSLPGSILLLNKV